MASKLDLSVTGVAARTKELSDVVRDQVIDEDYIAEITDYEDKLYKALRGKNGPSTVDRFYSKFSDYMKFLRQIPECRELVPSYYR
ncbi:hypothetical protein KY330_04780 [Candidatus Woesearchaeota archaeon]|nr:hypothetical protein [Candidatus Woesearchaeota archaeon]